jgi:leader peptidase (prepilin peptidase)/N-methyltransferase
MYPLVELAVAGLWAWMAWKYGLSLEALRWGAFGTVLVGIAFTDAREFVIPHGFTFGGLALAVVLGFADGAGPGLATLHDAIFGAGLVYLIGAAAELALRKEAMGGGDVAMMAMIGAFLGWQSVLAVLFLGAVVGLVLHGVVLPFRRARGSTPTAPASDPERPASAKTAAELKAEGYLPFGVSLAIAAGLVAFLLGPGAVRDWFAAYASAIGIAP